MDWLHTNIDQSMRTKKKFNSKLTPLLLGLLCVSNTAQAEFVLDFTPDNSGSMSGSVVHGNSSTGGQTPFLLNGTLPEIVTDPDTGLSYYHMILGDPADGFAMEVYIQRGYSPNWQNGTNSAVGGAGGSGGGNGTDPLDTTATVTANGEANPTKVAIRMVLNDGEMQQEFLKDKLNFKPKITQSVNADDISMNFSVDMSMFTYNDSFVPGIVSNTLQLIDPTFSAVSGSGDFNITNPCIPRCTDHKSSISAGRYTYTAGGSVAGSNGTYIYSDGGFNIDDVNWEDYYDNTDPTNVWSYTDNQPP